MLISAIAALTGRGVIGLNGQIPWSLPGDLQRFKRLTLGHTLLMGRATFESIGRSLPGRRTIVLSRQQSLLFPGCDVASSLDEALNLVGGEDEIFICGGEDLYRQALPLTHRLYLTEIDLDVAGDRYFPPFSDGDFEPLYEQCYAEENTYCFRILQRRSCSAVLTQDTLQRI